MSALPASLSGRLLLAASILVVLALLGTGVAMSFALRHFIQGQVDGRLDGQILTVTDALRAAPDGTLRLERTVDGPPFERLMSGWYWEVFAPDPVLRSRSLMGKDFDSIPAMLDERPKPVTVDATGPHHEALRARVKRVALGGMVVTIAATAPRMALDGPLRDALAPLALTLLVLGGLLIGGVVLQVRLGLRPLARLRAELVEVRTGRAERITGSQPSEIEPLVSELNSLLDQNAANLERARRHVANLAHGLKTPLATLALALEEPGVDPGKRLGPLVVTMDRRIRHHLARARAAALGGGDRSRTLLVPRLADHVAVFGRLYADKTIGYEVEVDGGVAVACETQDLDEMLGNLLDNACRWTRRRILVTATASEKVVDMAIEDDGPGLASEDVADVLRPGRRIDESAPGYGFGLPIARELAELYGGSLALTRSSLGGLKVCLRLPGA